MKIQNLFFLVLILAGISCSKKSTGPTPSPAPDLSKGLVSHFKFEDNLKDEKIYATGTGNPGYMVGKIGKAISLNLNANNSQKVVFNPPNSPFKSDKITIAFWLNSDIILNNTNPLYDVFHVFISCGNVGFLTVRNKAQCTAGFIISSNYSSQATLQNFIPKEWTHVVGTYDGNELKMYINGTLADTKIFIEPITGFSAPLVLGYFKDANNNDLYWNGIIDELYIYHRILTEEDINMLYKLNN